MAAIEIHVKANAPPADQNVPEDQQRVHVENAARAAASHLRKAGFEVTVVTAAGRDVLVEEVPADEAPVKERGPATPREPTKPKK